MHSWPGKNEHVIRRNTLAMPMLLRKSSFMWFAKCLFHDHIIYRIHLIFRSFLPGTQGPSWNWWILTLELWSCSLAMQPLGEDDLTCSSCMASCHKLFFCCCWGVFHFSSPEWWLLGLFAEQLKSGFPLFFRLGVVASQVDFQATGEDHRSSTRYLWRQMILVGGALDVEHGMQHHPFYTFSRNH